MLKWNDYLYLPNLIGKRNEYSENCVRKTTLATCIWKKIIQNQVCQSESKKVQIK